MMKHEKVKGSLCVKNGKWVCVIQWVYNDTTHRVYRNTGVAADYSEESLQLAAKKLADMMMLYH